MTNVLDKGFIALDGAFASDLAVVNAARVSFNSLSEEMTERDEGLIGFLMRNRHGSPFEHGYFRFLIKAPLAVVREHHRHRAGHSYNEWSGRYSQIEAEFYVPDFVRAQVGKPGAYTFEPVDDETRETAREIIERNGTEAFAEYERLLESGVAKEVARLVLPLSTYTKYYWSCNPRSLMHFCSLRNHSRRAVRDPAVRGRGGGLPRASTCRSATRRSSRTTARRPDRSASAPPAGRIRRWRPGFYPQGRSPASSSRFYAQRFDTVELNTTGYRLPAPEQFERWAAAVPDGFRFAPKLSVRGSDRARACARADRARSATGSGRCGSWSRAPRDDGLLPLIEDAATGDRARVRLPPRVVGRRRRARRA